jgi:Ca2+-binding RTX toxin-like protein
MLLTLWKQLLRTRMVSKRRSTRRTGPSVERLESRSLPTLTINFVAGALTITSDGADAIAVAANGSNEVTINGNTFDPGSGNVLASAVTSLSVTGGSGGNTIDTSGVTAAVFTNLTSVTLDGAGGNDTLTGSGFGETLIGGSGNDSLAGGAGDDTYQFAAGYGTDTVTEAAASGNDTMTFTGVTDAQRL